LSWKERLSALHETEMPDSDDVRNRQIRHQLVRRLLDNPVLYFDLLTEQELDYLTSQRSYLLNEIASETGLVPEVRKEGIALLDPEGDLTDTGLPETGTRGHATLLMAEWLANRLRSGAEPGVSWSELHARMAELTVEHAGRWRRGIEQPAARQSLAYDVIARLEALGLLEIRGDQILPRPAIARYAIGGDQ
jgi:uncharacterized protein (TIGR02678 family)